MRNYGYFLKLYALHAGPIADTYAYCLLRNHFHTLVRIKDESDLTHQSPPWESDWQKLSQAAARTGAGRPPTPAQWTHPSVATATESSYRA